MDILQENLPWLVPPPADSIAKRVEYVRDIQVAAASQEHNVKSIDLVLRPPTPGQLDQILDGLSALRAEAAQIPCPDNDDDDHKLIMIGGPNGFEIFAAYEWDFESEDFELPTLTKYDAFEIKLRKMRHTLEALRQNKEFRKTETGQIFAEQVEDHVTRLKQIWEKKHALQKARERYENDEESKAKRLPTNQAMRRNDIVWPSLCNNNRPRLDRAQTAKLLHDVKRSRQRYEFRGQILPRGCTTIIEHWRQDMDDIVDSILEVDQLSTAAKERAEMRSTWSQFFVSNDWGHILKISTSFVFERAVFPHVKTVSNVEDRTSVAGYITRKLDRARILRTSNPFRQTALIQVSESVTFDKLCEFFDETKKSWEQLQNEL